MSQRLLLLALAVFFVHALFELPHTYLYFLLPAAAMMGTLGALRGTHAPSGTVPRFVPIIIGLVLSAALGAAVLDYRAIERDRMAARLRAAHIHNPNPPVPSSPVFLGYLQTALEHLRIEPSRTASLESLDETRQTLQRYPALGGLVRYAHASALRARPLDAKWALERACLLNSARYCDLILQQWRELAQQEPELAAVELPRR